MPEAGYLPIPSKLARAGVKDMVRISDARMSGTAYGTIVLHVAPEAAVGGPLAAVRNGDRIRLSISNKRIDLLVDEAEIRRRLADWAAPPPPRAAVTRRSTARRCCRRPQGCDLDFLVRRSPASARSRCISTPSTHGERHEPVRQALQRRPKAGPSASASSAPASSARCTWRSCRACRASTSSASPTCRPRTRGRTSSASAGRAERFGAASLDDAMQQRHHARRRRLARAGLASGGRDHRRVHRQPDRRGRALPRRLRATASTSSTSPSRPTRSAGRCWRARPARPASSIRSPTATSRRWPATSSTGRVPAAFPVVAAGRGHKWLPKFRESTPDTVWDHWGVTAEQASLGRHEPEDVQRLPRRLQAGHRKRRHRQRHRAGGARRRARLSRRAPSTTSRA